MASTQVPGGVTGGQNHHLNAAAGPPTDFHFFPRIPGELQEMVWTEAVAELKKDSNVLFFTLTRIRTSEGRTMCFTPDTHTAVVVRGHRGFLEACQRSRQKALEALTRWTLFRLDPTSGNPTPYPVLFDFPETCLCIDGWEGQAIDAEVSRTARGLGFARNIQRLAFVISHGAVNEYLPSSLTPLAIGMRSPRDLQRLALLFHNTTQVAAVDPSASETKTLLGWEAFTALLSFKPFEQKSMVQEFRMTKTHAQRCRALDRAMISSLRG